MLIRLMLAAALTIAGIATVLCQTVPPEPRGERRKAAPTRSTEQPPRQIEQKWVEESLGKFFDLPGDILTPRPEKR